MKMKHSIFKILIAVVLIAVAIFAVRQMTAALNIGIGSNNDGGPAIGIGIGNNGYRYR